MSPRVAPDYVAACEMTPLLTQSPIDSEVEQPCEWGRCLYLTVSGLPAIIIQLVFIVVFSTPVWLGARIVGAKHPTLLRAVFSLMVGTLGSTACIFFSGLLALLLAPLSFLLAFKYVLGTSFLGAIVLALVALGGYVAMVYFLGAWGAGFHVPESRITV